MLSQVRYQDNAMVLHTDEALMPRRRGVWSSWNYLARGPADHRREVAVTYWMNRLQNLRTARPLFASLNPFRAPRAGATLIEKTYRHPQYDPAMLRARLAHARWADARKRMLNQRLAMVNADYLARRPAAARAFGRAEVLDKLVKDGWVSWRKDQNKS